MNITKIISVARGILGKLTDLLMAGRNLGLWNKKNTPTDGANPLGIHK